MEPRQVIVMRRDLGMRRGKEIAQGAHARLGTKANGEVIDASSY
jgi:peptidyl-tRNA hydrolase